MIINEGGTPTPTTTPSTQPYSSSWWTNQANLVRGGTLPSSTVGQATAFQLSQLGKGGYMDLYPEVFGMGGGSPMGFDQIANLRGQIADLENVRHQLINSDGGYISRWMIGNQISALNKQIGLLQGEPVSSLGRYKPTELPTPDWLKPYLEPAMPYTQENIMGTTGRKDKYGTKGTTASLRPLGAQTELTPGQLAFMNEYTAGGKAGSPKFFTTDTATRMTSQQPWWDYYQTQSQALMPSSKKLGTRWATASQK
jgi:hypothetical protein